MTEEVIDLMKFFAKYILVVILGSVVCCAISWWMFVASCNAEDKNNPNTHFEVRGGFPFGRCYVVGSKRDD